MITVAYINLLSRPQRNEDFLGNNRAELDASAFPWRRVDGVDGGQLRAEELIARGIIAQDGLAEGYEPHTWGHLGAALSHRALWEQAARAGDEDVLVVLEDDAQVCPQFGAQVRRVLELAKAREPWDVLWDVLHLGFNTDAPVTIRLDSPRMEIQLICQENGRPIAAGAPFAVSWPERPREGEVLLARVLDIHGICGYAVSTRGARRLLEACFPMTATSIDGTISRKTREGLLEAWIAIPPLVLSPNDHAASDTVSSATSRYNESI